MYLLVCVKFGWASYVQLLPFEILSAQHGIPTVVEKYIFLVTSDKNRVYYDLAKPFFE